MMSVVLVDFFAGCGGLSQGFSESGISIETAVELNHDAAASYRLNFPDAEVLERDIRLVDVDDLACATKSGAKQLRLFAGCAPCQPFAHHRNGASVHKPDSRLLLEFLRFVEALRPELVFVENVPGIKRSSNALSEFAEGLPREYHHGHAVLRSDEYGIPQTRERLVFVASRLGPIELPPPTHGSADAFVTVHDAIHDLPAIGAGLRHPTIPDHETMRLSPLNLERIRATPEGGDRRDWPEHLWMECHRGRDVGHTDAYGRLRWHKPAPTLTTRCISYSNGRYGHPDQDRAITVREAARLQTFPDEFRFVGGLTSKARQIGNAVPVALARAIGGSIMQHVMQHA